MEGEKKNTPLNDEEKKKMATIMMGVPLISDKVATAGVSN